MDSLEEDPSRGRVAGWFHGRFVEPWQASPQRIKRYVWIAFLAHLLAAFGELVYWYETGNGFFDHTLSPAAGASQAVHELASFHFLLYGSILLWWCLPATGWERLVVGLFTLEGIGLVYLGVATGHPIAIVPAAVVLVATLVWASDRLRADGEEADAGGEPDASDAGALDG